MNKIHKGDWGCIHRTNYVLDNYKDHFEQNHMFGYCLNCLKSENGVLTLKYKDYEFQALEEGFDKWSEPEFRWGDCVFIKSKDKNAHVDAICWHRKDKKYFYMLLDENNKKIKKRYYADELEKLDK